MVLWTISICMGTEEYLGYYVVYVAHGPALLMRFQYIIQTFFLNH